MIENLAELNTAITAFEQWRLNRRKSAGIPDDLILLAARAARACGTSRTASTLGLNASNFRKRIALLGENLLPVKKKIPNDDAVEKNAQKSLHFSRLDSREFYDKFFPSEHINSEDLRPEGAKTIHAQVILNNGRTFSFTSIEGLQILCGFLTKQGENL